MMKLAFQGGRETNNHQQTGSTGFFFLMFSADVSGHGLQKILPSYSFPDSSQEQAPSLLQIFLGFPSFFPKFLVSLFLAFPQVLYGFPQKKFPLQSVTQKFTGVCVPSNKRRH